MKNSATLSVRSGTVDAGHPGPSRRVGAGLPFGVAVIVLAVVFGGAGAARAENECGRPDAGTPVVCSPSNYDAAADGNIVYRPGEAHVHGFTIRLADDLSIRYDRDNPDDDQLVLPGEGDPLYSAVRIETDADHAGDISFLSSAGRDLERERDFGRPQREIGRAAHGNRGRHLHDRKRLATRVRHPQQSWRRL